VIILQHFPEIIGITARRRGRICRARRCGRGTEICRRASSIVDQCLRDAILLDRVFSVDFFNFTELMA